MFHVKMLSQYVTSQEARNSIYPLKTLCHIAISRDSAKPLKPYSIPVRVANYFFAFGILQQLEKYLPAASVTGLKRLPNGKAPMPSEGSCNKLNSCTSGHFSPHLVNSTEVGRIYENR